ncbi:beta-galactosidase [Erwinia billingiae]|uniref:beta-galactosidase n=1 Tax=Erwinia billingiae TaxID=182337 RepID=UPI0019D0C132|nr:beta-galactosidase [Erwinia billingiae]MBN7121118.1 beta-galactosidase [Erwinia billingiae]
MDKIWFGTAYYREYMPEERLEKDIAMMKAAGINYVRIAESTWSTFEPQEGEFDFTSVITVLDQMQANDIRVIIGTPTYAIPGWLAKKYPEVMAVTPQGLNKYGPRQKMDITSPVYRYYSERIIRKLLTATASHPAVIGFQVDNETKYYETSGPAVQIAFVKYLRKKFNDDLQALNQAFGLDYWSNRVDAWEDFPSVQGTINASLGAEFQAFQRQLVIDFLRWQVDLVGEYKSADRFVTHNFDFDWRNWSFGLRSEVDHFAASEVVDITGVDVYHPGQSRLTGAEIAFTGDIARTTKDKNYFVLETQAQAFKDWTPYPGQLRLQAFSHIANGASLVGYWHWHSIHNSWETYWKGLLSHDLLPNPVYDEACDIGKTLQRLTPELSGLSKSNRVAMLVSNRGLTAIDWHPWRGHQFGGDKNHQYNDLFRSWYDALYRQNIEMDILDADDPRIERYDVLIVPLLYAASDALLQRLNAFVGQGGHIIYSFKSGFANQDLKVRTAIQPGIISEACGVTYQLFVEPDEVQLSTETFALTEETGQVTDWMELLEPVSSQTEILARYQHPQWGKYAAITRNQFGKGTATYIGCNLSSAGMEQVFSTLFSTPALSALRSEVSFPLIIRRAQSKTQKDLCFIFNYSQTPQQLRNPLGQATSLIDNRQVEPGETLEIAGWDFVILSGGEAV